MKNEKIYQFQFVVCIHFTFDCSTSLTVFSHLYISQKSLWRLSIMMCSRRLVARKVFLPPPIGSTSMPNSTRSQAAFSNTCKWLQMLTWISSKTLTKRSVKSFKNQAKSASLAIFPRKFLVLQASYFQKVLQLSILFLIFLIISFGYFIIDFVLQVTKLIILIIVLINVNYFCTFNHFDRYDI